MTQEQRLDYLVEAFKADSVEYQNLETPADAEGKRRILRSLMNIRMPRQISEQTLQIQDLYLAGRAEEKGIVELGRIPTIRDALGSKHPHGDRLSIWQGDITRLQVGAIVNAANSQMLGCFQPMHACIDNCIHTYAGVQLRQECSRQMNQLRIRYGRDYEQPTACPMLTPGYNLPAEYVIHVVGPIVYGNLQESHRRVLADCYRNVLELCLKQGIKSVAFCCISTGVFRFPAREAAEIAVNTVSKWLDTHGSATHGKDCMERVIFNVFKDEDKELYEKLFSEE
ncbi:MAG: protein-ADP-ribose hydrolase [Lachnospiraceae bacterium]|nr:protein-ADP-ribose hydrolase [Lachnospiraceae bacterium]